jgi:hypothetical protein
MWADQRAHQEPTQTVGLGRYHEQLERSERHKIGRRRVL